jgi:hypothetical protein
MTFMLKLKKKKSCYLEWDIRTTPFKFICQFYSIIPLYGNNYMSSDENNVGLHQFHIKHILHSNILNLYAFIWINIICSF